MAEKKKRTVSSTAGQNALFKDATSSINRLASRLKSGLIDDAQFRVELDEIIADAGQGLNKASKSRLTLFGKNKAKNISDNKVLVARQEQIDAGLPENVVRLRERGEIESKARLKVAGEQVISSLNRSGVDLPEELKIRIQNARDPQELKRLVRVGQRQQQKALQLSPVQRQAQLIGEQTRRARIPNAVLPESIFPAKSAAAAIPAEVAALESATTPAELKAARRGIKIGTQKARAGARLSSGLAKGGIGATLGLALASSIFGNKDQGIDPQVQLALAQQLGAQQQNNSRGIPQVSRSLTDISKLVTILKGMQDLAGVQGAAPPQRLI